MKGLHTVDAYSTWGRTRVWYAAVRIAICLSVCLSIVRLYPYWNWASSYPTHPHHPTLPTTPTPILTLYCLYPYWNSAETTHGRNDSGPKWLTYLGRNDPPPKLAETTQAETTRPKRPRAETTRIRNMHIQVRINLVRIVALQIGLTIFSMRILQSSCVNT